MNRDIKMIQDALAREAKMVDGQCVVPGDFFDRLNAALNPPGPSVFDMLLDAVGRDSKERT